jgi:alkylation response protein AidB-like acyl-CoA dehydrogenase
MWSYTPPLRDMLFVMEELLGVRKDWADIPAFSDIDVETVPQILDAAAQFAVETLAPINAAGDLQGCRYDSGNVTTPEGFAQAYMVYREAGWPSLACHPSKGGQGLPQLLNAALYEMLFAVNHAWSMYPGLAHGAYECLRTHATDALKATYLEKIVSGEWLTTMCLTEPQAGSDVGRVNTKALPQSDGTYAISGSKIFISGGEHDLTDNIVHMVLARLPDAPPGTKGISLFLVPKFIPGAAPSRNGVQCEGIEKKMGIKGSATCVMTFAAATGWMIGEPNRGMAAMFVMMNAARLLVGLQGLGHAEMAYQNARRYAAERRQLRSPSRPDNAVPTTRGGADPIAYHPATRKTLLTLRAYVEGQRAVAYWCAHLLDVSEHHPEGATRTTAHEHASLLTPIVKSFFTEKGFQLSSAALQLWGGYGYIHDFGIEQSLRDSRIAMIYEGTNEIQAIDLLIRKVIPDGGQSWSALLGILRDEARACATVAECAVYAALLSSTYDEFAVATHTIVSDAASDPELAHRVANDYLYLAGLLLVGSTWVRAARLAAPRSDETFYGDKLQTAQFYFDYLMPEARLRLELLAKRHCALPWVGGD